MKYLASLLLLTFIGGCQEAKHLVVVPGDVVLVKINDFNWEIQRTTVYEITENMIKVYDKKTPNEVIESIELDSGSDVWKAVQNIDKLYTEEMTDPNVYDGTILTFSFTLKDGKTVDTHVSNLIIEDYAQLTKAVSDVVEREVHYHQYDSKKY